MTAAPLAIPSSAQPADQPVRSLAVLPFVNMSADAEQEYFSDGITEELLNVLAQVRDLRVAARTSSFAFKGQNVPMQEIGERLRVRHILEGSVRKAGGRVRITAQLIEVASGYHLWSQTYDRDLTDIFAIQDEISQSIADSLIGHLDLPALHTQRATAVSPEAHAAYLKGRHAAHRMDEASLRQSLEHYEEALRLAPDYLDAHLGIVYAYLFLADGAVSPSEALPIMNLHTERVLEVAPSHGDAWAMIAAVESNWGWNWARAHQACERALRHAGGSPLTHLIRMMMMMIHGRFAEADRSFDAAQRLDPLNPIYSSFREILRYFEGRHEDVIRQHAITQQLAPGFAYHDAFAGFALREMGRYDEALAIFAAAEPALGRPSVGRATTLARMGRIDEARAVVHDLVRLVERGRWVVPELVALGFLALGDTDRTIDWLQRGVAARSALAVTTPVWPDFAPIRSDPRYRELIAQTGVPFAASPPPPMVPVT